MGFRFIPVGPMQGLYFFSNVFNAFDGESEVQAVRRLKTLQPGALILFITMHDERAFVAEARKVGARGYVFKHHVHSHLLPAAREALRNGPFFSSAMQE